MARTKNYFTFLPTDNVDNPPTGGFTSGSQIISKQINAINYASYNFVNGMVDALISNGNSSDTDIYNWNGNLKSLIESDINGWIDYRINNDTFSSMRFEKDSNWSLITGESISTRISYTDETYYGSILGYNYVEVEYYNSLSKGINHFNKSFRMSNEGGIPYLKYSSTIGSDVVYSTKSYKIEYPTSIATTSELTLNSVQAYVCNYSTSPDDKTDIVDFITNHPEIKVLGCATYGVKRSSGITYYHNTWQVNTSGSDNTIFFYRQNVTNLSTFSTIISTNIHDDWTKWSLANGRDNYYEVLYFC